MHVSTEFERLTTAQRSTLAGTSARPASARSAGAVTLTLSDYAPAFTVPSHTHARPYFCYVSAGGFREVGVGGAYVASRGALVFHPAGETHSDEFGASGGRCFNIENRRTAGTSRASRASCADERCVTRPSCIARCARGTAASAVVAEGLTAALVARVGFDVEVDLARERRRETAASIDLSRAVEQLRADPCNPPSLSTLAHDAGLGALAFARSFRRQFRMRRGRLRARGASGDGEARAGRLGAHGERDRGGAGIRGPGPSHARLPRRNGLDAGGVQASDGGVAPNCGTLIPPKTTARLIQKKRGCTSRTRSQQQAEARYWNLSAPTRVVRSIRPFRLCLFSNSS